MYKHIIKGNTHFKVTDLKYIDRWKNLSYIRNDSCNKLAAHYLKKKHYIILTS